LEKPAGRKGGRSEDAHPADFFVPDHRTKDEVQPYRDANRQQGADKLPGR